MTPAARISAAIEVLDLIAAGTPPEQALTNWARGHRFAGSGDRAAIRDHVFDVLRRKRSCAAYGGGESGRALMLGLLAQSGQDPALLFTGDRFAPALMREDELARCVTPPELTQAQALDIPDWLLPECLSAFEQDAPGELARLRNRAPAILRVNTARVSVEDAQATLKDAGFACQLHPLAATALVLEGHPRGLKATPAYLDGLVELQDAASQAAVAMVPCTPDDVVLDYCAGGGGKALALAARGVAGVLAHDATPVRMKDLPQRAARAGVRIDIAQDSESLENQSFDVVVCDVPCSGSGAWRRAPQSKWDLYADKLDELCETQSAIVGQAATHVRAGGYLVYMTCSILRRENEEMVTRCLSEMPEFESVETRRFLPSQEGDGFFCATLTRKKLNKNSL